MKKNILILLFTALFISQFNAQEAKNKTELTFQAKALESDSVPQLVLHRGGMFDVYKYKLIDGKKLSYGELNGLLKTVPENKSLLTKKNIWTGIDYAFIAGLCAAVGMNIYANNKGWDEMSYYTAVGGLSCFLFATCSGMIAQSYRSAAVDNYNLYVMGIPLN